MASGSTGTAQDRPPARGLCSRSCRPTSPPLPRVWPALMALRPSSPARAGCTTTRECGWRPMWCTGAVCAGRPVPAGFFSTCSMATLPATTSAGSGWPAASATSPTSSTAANLERFSSGRYCNGPVRWPAAAVRSRPATRQLQARLFQPWIPGRRAGLRRRCSHCHSPCTATARHCPCKADSHSHRRSPVPAAPAAALAARRGPGAGQPGTGRAHPGAPAVFVFDQELIEGRTATTGGAPLAEGRLRFLHECLAELPVAVKPGRLWPPSCWRRPGQRGRWHRHQSGGGSPLPGRSPERLAAAAAAARVLEPEPFVALPREGKRVPPTCAASPATGGWRSRLVWGDPPAWVEQLILQLLDRLGVAEQLGLLQHREGFLPCTWPGLAGGLQPAEAAPGLPLAAQGLALRRRARRTSWRATACEELLAAWPGRS
jgi:hypothetical protein